MTGDEFENEVRNIARALWPSDPGSGASLIVDGRERDCIYPQEHVVHYVEVTLKRTMDKVKYDADKMVLYKKKEEAKGGLVKLWIVTAHEPTGEQRTYCTKEILISFRYQNLEEELLTPLNI